MYRRASTGLKAVLLRSTSDMPLEDLEALVGPGPAASRPGQHKRTGALPGQVTSWPTERVWHTAGVVWHP